MARSLDVLSQGFAATSVDAVVERAEVTKGTFFYHFDSKAYLARELLHRFARYDRALLKEGLERAERMSRDPLPQILIFIGYFEEMFSALKEPYAGRLFASYANEAQLFDAGTMKVIGENFSLWRKELGVRLKAAAKLHPPKFDVHLPSFATP